MARRSSPLDRMKLVSPCSTDWRIMRGDDEVRFCDQCNKHVYNISNMTRKQAESLLANSEGRLCAKFERRADGTVQTADYKESRISIRWHAPKAASAIIATLLGFGSNTFAQSPATVNRPASVYADTSSQKAEAQSGRATLFGFIRDIQNAGIDQTYVVAFNEDNKREYTFLTLENGEYRFSNLDPGKYTFKATAQGFITFTRRDIILQSDQTLRMDVTLNVGTFGEVIIIQKPGIGEKIWDILISPYTLLKEKIRLLIDKKQR